MRVPFRSSGPSNTGGVGWLVRKCTARPPITTGRSQWLFELSRKTACSAGEYQSFGAGVAGSSGSLAPGMSFQRNFWKVRIPVGSIG